MSYCCVPFCTSASKRENISFHEFPSDPFLTTLWLKAIARKDFVPNYNSASSRVCGKHFEESDFFSNRKKRCLKPGVLPTRFDGDPSYKKPVAVKKRRPVKRRRLDAKAGNSSIKICEVTHSSSTTLSEEQGSASVPPTLTEESHTQTVLKATDRNNLLMEIKKLKKLVKSRDDTIALLHRKINSLEKQVCKNVCSAAPSSVGYSAIDGADLMPNCEKVLGTSKNISSRNDREKYPLS